MNQRELERQFTSLLVNTKTQQAYIKLTSRYLLEDGKTGKLIPEVIGLKKLEDLQNGNPREWISKVFSEWLDIPYRLASVDIMWQRQLDELGVE